MIPLRVFCISSIIFVDGFSSSFSGFRASSSPWWIKSAFILIFWSQNMPLPSIFDSHRQHQLVKQFCQSKLWTNKKTTIKRFNLRLHLRENNMKLFNYHSWISGFFSILFFFSLTLSLSLCHLSLSTIRILLYFNFS